MNLPSIVGDDPPGVLSAVFDAPPVVGIRGTKVPLLELAP
jgi:hypothetical protein